MRRERSTRFARVWLLRLVVLLGALALPGGVAAQISAAVVTVRAPSGAGGDTVLSATPTFVVQVSGLPNATTAFPLRFRLQIDYGSGFRTPAFDTTLTVRDSVVSVAPPRALDSGRRFQYRAFVIDPAGNQAASPTFARVAPEWLSLVGPATSGSGTVVNTRRPTFVWRSPPVNDPPGPWEYDIVITSLGNRAFASSPQRDTVFQISRDLEANTSYRWSVTARLRGTSQSIQATSVGTFVVEDSTLAVSTLLYQNFPNPFPSALAEATCIRFDLERASDVQLEILTPRGLRVRRLLPSADFPTPLPPGRYGRPPRDVGTGCDARLRWDGTDDDGRPVPAGLYYLRFRADGVQTFRKVLFRGRS